MVFRIALILLLSGCASIEQKTNLLKIHNELQSRFTWVSDQDQYNKAHFVSYEQIVAGQAGKFYGDCEEYALAATNLAWSRHSYRMNPVVVTVGKESHLITCLDTLCIDQLEHGLTRRNNYTE